jgi:hypothetical protein
MMRVDDSARAQDQVPAPDPEAVPRTAHSSDLEGRVRRHEQRLPQAPPRPAPRANPQPEPYGYD